MSGSLESVGEPGAGKWVTIFANAGHAYIEVAGIYLDTAAARAILPTHPRQAPDGAPSGPGRPDSRCATRRASKTSVVRSNV